jgi:hypothetical protein
MELFIIRKGFKKALNVNFDILTRQGFRYDDDTKKN